MLLTFSVGFAFVFRARRSLELESSRVSMRSCTVKFDAIGVRDDHGVLEGLVL